MILSSTKVYSSNGLDYYVQGGSLQVTDGVNRVVFAVNTLLYLYCEGQLANDMRVTSENMYRGLETVAKNLVKHAIAHHFPSKEGEKTAMYLACLSGGTPFRAFKRMGDSLLTLDFHPVFESGLRSQITVFRQSRYVLSGRPSIVDGLLRIPTHDGETRVRAVRIL